MPIASGAARREWRSGWKLPVAAAVGDSMSGLQTYSIGSFLIALEAEFAWKRSEILLGLTLSGLIIAAANVFVGAIIDRFGPRRVGIAGVVATTSAFALLGTVNGSLVQWFALWTLIGLCSVWVQAVTWTNAVAARFDAGRGLAIGMTLAGGSAGGALLPIAASLLVLHLGWRHAFFAVAGLSALIVLPVLLRYFDDGRGRRASPGEPPPSEVRSLPGKTLGEGLRMPAFYRLLLTGGLFSFCATGIAVNLVPLLVETGASALRAASLASLIGVLAIAARLTVGYLLDRLPAVLVGAAMFTLPILGAALLMFGGANLAAQIVAVMTFGVMLGGEYDIIAYLATRHFGMRSFGALLGALVTALALGAAFGPYAAGAMHDHFGDYRLFLALAIALMVIGAVTLVGLRTPETLDPCELA